jgi:hypothetical protein
MDLRSFQVGAIDAELRELRVRDQYEDMLEGTPHLHRRLVLMVIDSDLEETPGLHVPDLDRIRSDMEARVDDWMPRERVLARLSSQWQPEGTIFGHTRLSVLWFQHATQDPFARLAEIIRPLDWRSVATFHPFDPENS